MLNYDQIQNFMEVYRNFNELSDLEIVSYMQDLPQDWNEFIINSKLTKAVDEFKGEKEKVKTLASRCTELSNKLGFEISEKMSKMFKTNQEFYNKNVVYLRAAMDLLNRWENEEDCILEGLHPKTISYLKEVSLGKEKYEMLQLLKDNNQI